MPGKRQAIENNSVCGHCGAGVSEGAQQCAPCDDEFPGGVRRSPSIPFALDWDSQMARYRSAGEELAEVISDIRSREFPKGLPR